MVTVEFCRNYIKGPRASEDAVIQFLLDAAKNAADEHLGNDFLDEDGEELPIPEVVERWIVQQVARDYHLKPQGLTSEMVVNLGSITFGPRDYSDITPFRAARYWL